MGLTWLEYGVALAAGIAAGLVDSIAGGGGMITVPILLALGLPPHLALGTNKLQSSFGSATAALRYRGHGLVRFRDVWFGVLMTALGAAAGTGAVQVLDQHLLARIVPVLLCAVFLYFLFMPMPRAHTQHVPMPRALFFALCGVTIGFYDGFFGPGTGSFWAVALVSMAAMPLLQATAVTKVMNFTSNAMALLVFVLGGNVVWGLGLLMGVGEICGAWLGTHLAVRRGTRFIRMVLLLVVAATIGYLLWQQVR
jgi:uncharacterized membrane protein YfcA